MRILLSGVFLLVLILLIPFTPASASRLAVDIAPGTFGVAFGGDTRNGYFIAGISAIFIDEFPWSYVPTPKSLSGQCAAYNADPTTVCERKGWYHDGEEWELYGKWGYRIPSVRRLFVEAGAGISHRKSAELYLFCSGLSTTDPTNPPKSCERSEDFVTWGKVRDRYYPTVQGGLGFELRRNFLLSLDYHSRRGPLLGMTWRF